MANAADLRFFDMLQCAQCAPRIRLRTSTVDRRPAGGFGGRDADAQGGSGERHTKWVMGVLKPDVVHRLLSSVRKGGCIDYRAARRGGRGPLSAAPVGRLIPMDRPLSIT